MYNQPTETHTSMRTALQHNATPCKAQDVPLAITYNYHTWPYDGQDAIVPG